MSRLHWICYAMALACGLALIPVIVLGDAISLSGTVIELRETEMGGAEAEVVMSNRPVNGPSDNGDYTLALGGLTVAMTFTWDAGPEGQDRVSVLPPDGMICQPTSCTIEIQEGQDGILYLIPWEGM